MNYDPPEPPDPEDDDKSRSFCFKCGYFTCQCDEAYENWRESKW